MNTEMSLHDIYVASFFNSGNSGGGTTIIKEQNIKCSEDGRIISITFPNNVKSLATNCYAGNTYLENVVIPDSVTTIGNEAFAGCVNLKSAKLSNNITVIPKSMFDTCRTLKEITIPNGVTTIKSNAFEDCQALTSAVIPDSVTDIETVAFSNCIALKDIYYTGTQEQWEAITKASGWNNNLGVTVGGTTIHYNYIP